jgi:DNA-binding transcriptional ArsR family regulator
MDAQLSKAILVASLMPTEKLIGLALAYHINARTKKWKISQARIAEECGVSTRTVRRAIRALEAGGYITVKQSGRKCIFEKPLKSLVNYDRTPVSYQSGHGCPLNSRKSWELDTEYSTKCEEEYKRLPEAPRKEEYDARYAKDAD